MWKDLAWSARFRRWESCWLSRRFSCWRVLSLGVLRREAVCVWIYIHIIVCVCICALKCAISSMRIFVTLPPFFMLARAVVGRATSRGSLRFDIHTYCRIYIYIYTYIYIHVYIYTCTYIYVHIFTYIYVHKRAILWRDSPSPSRCFGYWREQCLDSLCVPIQIVICTYTHVYVYVHTYSNTRFRPWDSCGLSHRFGQSASSVFVRWILWCVWCDRCSNASAACLVLDALWGGYD